VQDWAKAKTGLVPILTVPLSKLLPSPENEKLYHPVDLNAQDIKDLAKDISVKGVLDPLLVTADYVIVSGAPQVCGGGSGRSGRRALSGSSTPEGRLQQR